MATTLKPSDLSRRTLPMTVDLYGEPLTLQVRPNKWTLKLLTDERGLAECMVEVIESWDLEDGGVPVPITVEAIREQLGLPVQQTIWAGIVEGFDPNSKTKSKDSSTG